MHVAILSPHFDDAVLSCWHVLRGPAAVTVVNVFAGAPPAGSPPGWWDRLTGVPDPGARVAERAAEDLAALALAGRAALNLDLLEAQHRRAPLRPEALAGRLAAALAGFDGIHAPAALGSHPDHALVRDAALLLRSTSMRTHLYADLPHAIAAGWPTWVAPGGGRTVDERWAQALAGIGPLRARVHALALAEQRRKLAAIRTYRTQVDELDRMLGPIGRSAGYEVSWELDSA